MRVRYITVFLVGIVLTAAATAMLRMPLPEAPRLQQGRTALAPATTEAPSAAHAPLPPNNKSVVQLKAGERSYALVVTQEESIEDIMRALARDGLSFEGKEYPSLGFFVETINGTANTGGRYWMLYINGSLSSLGISQARVRAGDVIEWKYE